ncbi:MAG: hypothetical protein JOZ96_09630 [Acidobacteria bacterium]|nr:hypothetical protein [Acidobacteriota bacterium]
MMKGAYVALAALSFLFMAATAAAQETLHPAFTVTEDQLRKAFADFEKKGKRHERVTFGEEHAASVQVSGPTGNRESLKLSVVFLSPLWQARKSGYEFGLVARTRTEADRADFLRVVLQRIKSRAGLASFEVTLAPPRDSNVTPPQVSFVMLGSGGARIDPSARPQFDIPGRDILASPVETLTFKVGTAAAPLVTNKMEKLVVVVNPGEGEQRLEYDLKR